MLAKSVDSVSDFKVIDDNGFRRIFVFGMGWTGYTLLNSAAFEVVRDDELSKMAYYFYNLGKQHGLKFAKDEGKNFTG
jgi:hypothetical protein